MDSFISFLIIYGPSPALILLILAAVIVGLIWLGVTRPRRRRRRIGRGIYVVGSHAGRYASRGYRNSGAAKTWRPDWERDAFPSVFTDPSSDTDPYRVGALNPFSGRFNTGSPNDSDIDSNPYTVGAWNPFTGRVNTGSTDDFDAMPPPIGSEYT